MKRLIITLLSIVYLSTTSTAQEKLQINISESCVKWSGKTLFHFGGHEGTIDIIDGHLIKTNDLISGGTLTLDMNTIVSTDIEKSEAKQNLEDHLKDPDFFDVKKYPHASITITKVEYFENKTMRFDANLTIKGATHSIQFNVKPDHESESYTTKFKIDRRKWNVNYTSKMRDGAISDAIGFEVKISL